MQKILFFFFQAEDGIRDYKVTGVQTCALPISHMRSPYSLEEVIRLYGLRMWVEQSYKQVKHALGWSQYQVRSDRAMRRHWQLVCCAFSFCWYHASHGALSTAQEPLEASEPSGVPQSGVPAPSTGAG